MTLQPKHGQSSGRGTGLALIGYRGTGKTTVGQILADRLGLRFLDCDRELEARGGCSIPEIFAQWGEPEFRNREEQTLRELVAEHPGTILSTGGGVVLRSANRDLLRAFGQVVWLRAGAEELARRLEAQARQGFERPALTSAGTLAEIALLLEQRRPLYQQAADFSVDTTDRTPAEIARVILENRRDLVLGPGST